MSQQVIVPLTASDGHLGGKGVKRPSEVAVSKNAIYVAEVPRWKNV